MNYENAPSNCELQLYIGDDEKRFSCKASNSGGEIFTLTKLKADGLSKDIVVYFTEQEDCAFIASDAFKSPTVIAQTTVMTSHTAMFLESCSTKTALLNTIV